MTTLHTLHPVLLQMGEEGVLEEQIKAQKTLDAMMYLLQRRPDHREMILRHLEIHIHWLLTIDFVLLYFEFVRLNEEDK